MGSRAVVAACVVATLAFAAYTRTLLPGVDLGDTGGFQAAVLWPEISARQAYPLYYALARPFVAAVTPDTPALGLNLFSAVWAAVSAGLLTAVVTLVTRSAAGGVVAGLLLAFSYTYWMQAIIAEVYALHLALVGACLVALVAWHRQPSIGRLAWFFAVYAVAFGNHLSMILLLAPFAAFLLLAAPRPADMLRPRVIGIALLIAAAGALQYLPQFVTVWNAVDAPSTVSGRLAAFWFDVTKSDWRESMVLGIRASQVGDRLAMLAFDARQQFGAAGLALAVVGLAALWHASRPWAVLVGTAYAVNTVFAFTYNVGDPHVFFLPGHYFTALAAGAAVAAAARRLPARRLAAGAAVAGAMAYAGWRAYDTWPAMDRSADRRAERLVTRMTLGLDEREALLATQLNWQVENALLYETRYRLERVVWLRLSDVLLHFPLLVRDNHATGRDVVVTAAAVPQIVAAYGPLLPLVPDPVPPAPSLAARASRVRPGTAYVLTSLTPPRDEALDADDLAAAVSTLTRGHLNGLRGLAYEVVVGRAGDAPLLHLASARPFRHQLSLPEGDLEIRMEGWVSIETFRRGGFGHVLLDRRQVLTAERGVGLAELADGGEPFYAAGLYAIQPRFRIPAGGLPELALLHYRCASPHAFAPCGALHPGPPARLPGGAGAAVSRRRGQGAAAALRKDS